MIRKLDAAYLIKVSFIIMNLLILRSNLEETKIISTFLKETKREIIDKTKSSSDWIFSILYEVFWLYSLYLFSKRWEIEDLAKELNSNESSLTTPESEKIILMLKEETYDEQELTQCIRILEGKKIRIRKNIQWEKPLMIMKTFFGQYNINDDKFGASFQHMNNETSALIYPSSSKKIRISKILFIFREL